MRRWSFSYEKAAALILDLSIGVNLIWAKINHLKELPLKLYRSR